MKKWIAGRKKEIGYVRKKDHGDVEEKRRARREKRMNGAEEVVEQQQVSFRYVDEFIALKCAEDLTRLQVYPNGKVRKTIPNLIPPPTSTRRN